MKKSNLEKQISQKTQFSPTVMRAVELVEYKKGLHQGGHIVETSSVRGYLGEIGQRMIAGKPMFLHGPTGTGKTSLARKASESLMGTKPYMVYCNPKQENQIYGARQVLNQQKAVVFKPLIYMVPVPKLCKKVRWSFLMNSRLFPENKWFSSKAYLMLNRVIPSVLLVMEKPK